MGAMRDRRFQRLLAGESLSTFGDTALYLTLGIWAKTLTGSNAAAGGVFLALGIPALFSPLAGHLADRVARRPLLLITNAATGLMVLSLLAVHSAAAAVDHLSRRVLLRDSVQHPVGRRSGAAQGHAGR